jgi:hypothetical protein
MEFNLKKLGEKMKSKFITMCLTVSLVLAAVSAFALSPNYDSTFSPVPTKIESDDFITFSFTPAQGSFTSALLDINISNLQNSSRTNGLIKFTAPPSGEFYSSEYMFTSDLKSGHNTFNLNPYLTSLNLANSTSGINLGLYLNRGGVTLNSARLTGTVAPEPASMALISAGLFALPFARRLRKAVNA